MCILIGITCTETAAAMCALVAARARAGGANNYQPNEGRGTARGQLFPIPVDDILESCSSRLWNVAAWGMQKT